MLGIFKKSGIFFDDKPTEGSNNAVTSGGVYNALQGGGGGSDINALYPALNGLLLLKRYANIQGGFHLVFKDNMNLEVFSHPDLFYSIGRCGSFGTEKSFTDRFPDEVAKLNININAFECVITDCNYIDSENASFTLYVVVSGSDDFSANEYLTHEINVTVASGIVTDFKVKSIKKYHNS